MPLFKNRSVDDQADSLAAYMPGGRLTEGRYITKAKLRKYLRALATELMRYQSILEDTATEHDITVTQNLINEWEAALGIPQSCFGEGTYTITERRAHLLMVLNELHGTTIEDFIKLADLLGYEITIDRVKPHAVFPMQFPIYFFPNGKAAQFSIVVHLPSDEEPVGFPLHFPIPFYKSQNSLLQCLFEKMKPANVKIFYKFDA